jgi:hypothetical protein
MLRRALSLSVLFQALAFSGSASPLSALPGVTGTLQAQAGGNQAAPYSGPFTGGGFLQANDSLDDIATSEAQISPHPVLSVFAEVNAGAGIGIASAGIDYYVEANGPSGTMVPIILSGGFFFETEGGGLALNGGFAQLADQSFNYSQCVQGANGACPFSLETDILSGTPTHIGLVAEVIGGPPTQNGAPDATDSLKLDPIVTIDHSFASANQFTLVFSPGVGNQATDAPEPRSLILTAAGIILMLMLARYRGVGPWRPKTFRGSAMSPRYPRLNQINVRVLDGVVPGAPRFFCP